MKLRNFLHILALSLALAAYASWVLPRPRSGASPNNEDSIPALDIPLLRLEDAEALWQQSSTLFVDVRSPSDYDNGHIAGALNLPDEESPQQFAPLKPRLERAAAIVVYCKSTDCGKSYWSALRLWQLGLTQVKIYPAGWHEWSEHNLPVTRAGQ